jgi:flagellar hook protein FlgE
MLDSIFIGMSGLTSYSKGLKVVSNNLTNVNTPGFKGSKLQFANLLHQEGGGQSASLSGNAMQNNGGSGGSGIGAMAAVVNFSAGELQQTGNQMDLAVNGEGLFVLKDSNGTRYTRDGQFRFDADGLLTSSIDGSRVQGLTDRGALADISLNAQRTNPAKASSLVNFAGNLSTDTSTLNLDNIKVFDAVGGEHALSLKFTNTGATTAGTWQVDVSDGVTAVGTGSITFVNGVPKAGASAIAVTYAPTGVPPLKLSLDFSGNATSFAGGSTSTMAMTSQNGYASGVLLGTSFDNEGYVVGSFANGQTAKLGRLALARVASDTDLVETGGNAFTVAGGTAVQLGHARTKAFGGISSGVVEGSNVDMAEQFSELIVMQRGYQASSHVISTANDLIQELFDMKGHR